MIRLLVTNGCSCTRGEELADPATQAWPVVLGKLLGVPHVNLARDGCSNRRIVRSTVDRVDEARHRFSAQPDEVLVLLAWTQSARHEYYSLRERPEVRTSPPSANHPDDRHWQGIGPWRQDAGHRPSRAFYDHLWSDEGQLANMFLDWVMLDRFLRHAGYLARYAFAFPVEPDISEPAVRFLRQLDSETVWGGLPPTPGMALLEMPEGMARGPGGHPLAEGHEWFATSLAEWLLRGGMATFAPPAVQKSP
jgi:hypothetical protein